MQTIIKPANADVTFRIPRFNPKVKMGSIHIRISNDFNGTTSSAALQGSNDGGDNWFTVFADDDVTELNNTLNPSTTNYIWNLKRILYYDHQVVYLKGDASIGNIYVNCAYK